MKESLRKMGSNTVQEEIVMLRNELERERSAREKAETLLQNTSESLYQSNLELKELNASLEKNILRRTSTLTLLVKNLHAGVLLEDENGRILLINKELCEIFRITYDPEMLVGQIFSESTGFSKHLFDDPDGFERGVAEALSQKNMRSDHLLRMKDGRVLKRDFLPIHSGEEYMGHLWQYRDVTEQFYVEKKIRQSEEKYRGIFENMELGLVEVARDQRVIKAYTRFCEMTGYSQEELSGKSVKELFVPQDADASVEKLNGSERRDIYEARIRKKDGEVIWVLIGESPIYDDTGSLSGTVGIYYDITDRKELENELRRAREVAERAREAEKEFLANMSHEIRNPINAMVGLINLLYDTQLSDEQLSYLNNIKYASDILVGLISGILDHSKIEAGKIELDEKPVEMDAIIRSIVQTYRFKTLNKDIAFSTEIDPELGQLVMADPTIINQILLNLIGNSVKFTESGEIKVRARVADEDIHSMEVEISVSDTGIGISADQQQKIFDSFHQSDQQIKLKYGGAGLGLAIVRKLLILYNGTIQVHSSSGEGATFTFNLKLKKAHYTINRHEGQSPRDLSTNEIKQVLVIEDNKLNQQYLAGLLKKWDIAFDLANHGEEALDFTSRKLYDLILMDIRMPVMDGYETTIRIRNAEHDVNKNVPIVALTASALVDEKERAMAAGMNYHLTKPFSSDQLLDVMNQVNASYLETKGTVCNGSVAFRYSANLDQQYLERFYEEDLERAAFMFRIFLENIDNEIENLKTSFSKKDWKQLASLAHKIKPNFTMVGLTALTAKVQEMEELATIGAGKSLEEIVPGFFRDFKNKRKLVEEELASMNSYMESGHV